MKILSRLPYFPEHKTVTVHDEQVDVRPHQIIVWVSVSVARMLEWDSRTPVFPALLDPGNNFNFSIFDSQLIRWAGIQPALLRVLGRIKEGGKRYPRHEADVWLHRNLPGTWHRQTEGTPFRLTLDKGIAIYPDQGPSPPHLPLLGLRALTDNNLQTLIDSEHLEVSLHTSNWISRLLRTLRVPPY